MIRVRCSRIPRIVDRREKHEQKESDETRMNSESEQYLSGEDVKLTPARMSSNSRKMNQTQKQFSLNRAASEKRFPMNSFTPPQKLPIRNVSLFTLHISLLAVLMIAALPQGAFAQQGVDTGYGWCGRVGHPSVKVDCPICARNNRSQNYAPATSAAH